MLRPSSSNRASELARPPERIAPCALNVQELHGPVLTSCWPPNSPGTSTRTALYEPAVGIAFRMSFDNTVCRCAFWTSTTGVSPVTVTVSATAPTRMSALTLAVNDPVSSMPSRFVALKPESVNVTEYVPGRKFSIRYWPVPSVMALRVFSISAGLAASTVTPGSTAPDVSLTTPAMDACANTACGTTIVSKESRRTLMDRRTRTLLGSKPLVNRRDTVSARYVQCQ